jgi:hypothetical protein
MSRDIIRTWPAFIKPRRVHEIFTHDFGEFYFTLGHGKPKDEIDRLWWTYRGHILGSFKVNRIVQNLGQLPKLRSLSGEKSEWQIRHGNWVAICRPPFVPLRDRVFHESFRGWRYFELESYRGTIDAKVKIA